MAGTTGARPSLQRDRSRFVLGAATLACIVSVVPACLFGPFPIPAQDVLTILLAKLGLGFEYDLTHSLIVWDIRLSRIVLAWMVGAALALSGTVFQGILRNPLADPFTIGVSSGAAFGASLAIYFGFPVGLSVVAGVGALPIAAMGGAFLALCAVILLGKSGGTLRRETLILSGVVVATFLAALISLIKSLDEDSVASIVFWIMGSFQGRGWAHVYLLLPWCLLGSCLIWRYSRELDILTLGEVQACQLGMDAARVRLLLLIGASMLTGASVAVSGVIGFVGLVIPHLLRLIQGGAYRPLLINSAVTGGLLLLWSDVLARTILPEGAELPVGVVTALLGGPFFCLLLRKKGDGSVI